MEKQLRINQPNENLRKSGSMFMQVLMLTPATGTKWYADTYSSGMAFKKVGSTNVDEYMIDGNYVVASKHKKPWTKQLNLLLAYTYFFNPLRFLIALALPKSKIPFADAETRPVEEVENYTRAKKLRRKIKLKSRAHLTDAVIQLWGMSGLFHNYRRTLGWVWKLYRGKIERYNSVPVCKIPMRSVDGIAATHALPGTELAKTISAENKNRVEFNIKTKSG